LITAAALFVTITIRSTSLTHLTGAHFCLHTSVRLGCPSDTVLSMIRKLIVGAKMGDFVLSDTIVAARVVCGACGI
jgi:hypothetical protein